jgi:hypothetical protein
MVIRSFVALLLGFALLGLVPTAALAYYPCNGPGPGEVLIGVDNSNGVQTPLCEYVGEDGGGGGDPGGYWVDSYGALAWATDPAGYATYSYSYGAASQAEAEARALSECQSAGFRDCRPATFVVNGSIAIVIDNAGTLHAEWGATDGDAKKTATRLCRQRGGKGCKLEGMVSSPAEWVSY